MTEKKVDKFTRNRPKKHGGEGDDLLPGISKNLKRRLMKLQKRYIDPYYRLTGGQMGRMAILLVELAEDLHNDIGLWRALETYHGEFYDSILPRASLLKGDSLEDSETFHPARFEHFLWKVWPEFEECDLDHRNTHLDKLALEISTFLKGEFASVPRDSSIEKFLNSPHEKGLQVYIKLAWLGMHSYLFRTEFKRYWQEMDLGEEELPSTAAVLDGFILSKCTRLSGLMAHDILVSVLDLDEEEKESLRKWDKSHHSLYEVLSPPEDDGQIGTVKTLNILNDEEYTIRMRREGESDYEPGNILFGDLLPWCGEWLMAANVKIFDNWTEEMKEQIKDRLLFHTTSMTYPYRSDMVEKARQVQRERYQAFVEKHGDNLTTYPSGEALAEDLDEEIKENFQTMPARERRSFKEDTELDYPTPEYVLPPGVYESTTEVGVFYSETRGMELMADFDLLKEAMEKKGEDLTDEEWEIIVDFINTDVISVDFVEKLVEQYGPESIGEVFQLEDCTEFEDLQYILRTFKGKYYRDQYPNLSWI